MTLPPSPADEVHVDDEGFLTEYDEWDETSPPSSPPTSASS
jgi:hypothetical protein